MTFPVYFHLFGLTLHPHLVLEGSAYALGLTLRFALRRDGPRLAPAVPPQTQLWLLCGLAIGALVGARIVAWFDMPHVSSAVPLAWLLGGKSIVGALLGGWLGLELVKRLHHIRHSTGDTWAIPLLASIALGRVGCFLTGLSDHTYGTPTRLPWGVNFGDGITRHPTQLYESAFCLLMIPVFWHCAARLSKAFPGALFRLFIITYMLFRVAIEFIKPRPRPMLGLSDLQVIALLAAIYAAAELFWMMRHPPQLATATAAENQAPAPEPAPATDQSFS